MSEMVFRPPARRRRATLNITSLIDVLFLLLIFFMLTSTFRRSAEMKLELPDSTTSTPLDLSVAQQETEIVLEADGRVLLDGEEVAGDQLRRRLADRLKESPDRKVLLNAAASSRHADVVHLIDLVREVGFTGLSIGTRLRPGESAEPVPSEEPPQGPEGERQRR